MEIDEVFGKNCQILLKLKSHGFRKYYKLKQNSNHENQTHTLNLSCLKTSQEIFKAAAEENIY